MIQVLSAVFVIDALVSIQQALLKRHMLFKSLAVRTLGASLVSGVVAVILAFSGYGVWSLVVQQLVRAAVGCIVLWAASDWRPKLNISRSHFRDMMGFSMNIIGINALTFVNRRADQLLIGYFLGPTALGYYTVGYRILNIMITLLVNTTSQVALPAFSRLQDDYGALRRGFCTAINLVSFIAFPAFLAISALAPYIVPHAFGDHWTPSIPVMQVLALIGIVQSVVYLSGQVMMALGRAQDLLKLHTINSIANLAAFAIAVHWGITAVAAAFVIRGYVLSPLWVLILRKQIALPVKTYLGSVKGPAVASFVMYLQILATSEYVSTVGGGVVMLASGVFVGVLSYVALVYLLDRSTIRNIMRVGGMVKNTPLGG